MGQVNDALPGYVCAASLCRDPVNVRARGGRMYGVVTYVRTELAPQHSTLSWDLEGRALITELPHLGVAVLNVYAVNGTDKPYFDHEQQKFDGDRHAFKRRFIDRLLLVCRTLEQRGLALILAGDWNVSQTEIDTVPRLRTEEPHALARKLFAENFVAGLALVDIYRHLHPDARAYTWFNRRARPGKMDAARVDFILISKALMPAVESAEVVEDPALRYASDHAPVLLRLCLPVESPSGFGSMD